jgi:hypothetical protein
MRKRAYAEVPVDSPGVAQKAGLLRAGHRGLRANEALASVPGVLPASPTLRRVKPHACRHPGHHGFPQPSSRQPTARSLWRNSGLCVVPGLVTESQGGLPRGCPDADASVASYVTKHHDTEANLAKTWDRCGGFGCYRQQTDSVNRPVRRDPVGTLRTTTTCVRGIRYLTPDLLLSIKRR